MAFFNRKLSDAELMAGIRAGGTQRRLYENKLYEKYDYLIADGTHKHRLDEDDCASAYSDAILTVFEHISNGRFEGRSGLKTYLYQIFTNKCVDAIRKKTTNRSSVHDTLSLDDALLQLPDVARSAVQDLIAQSDVDNLHRHLRELGEKCHAMILAWGEGYSDDEIAQTMGYNSAAVAKTSRLRCLEKLRERFRNAL
ncbi:sigma-70 family RNA polymerase sigma factor [Spirosoma taeanense]|uniref:Sigma-70 family RNA polymerase sigma factor n=1 Tax=Spirosoma taeanense TaxID=2735870 RepID=A0A6M5Y4V4_9BACT|nr:sigma-70 family RNA polymerase sigma factor [Spirosoma taeanense]QJW89547.1 sigma-70 family RNA polymerase sigma factor [Spirosoma taeanense]